MMGFTKTCACHTLTLYWQVGASNILTHAKSGVNLSVVTRFYKTTELEQENMKPQTQTQEYWKRNAFFRFFTAGIDRYLALRIVVPKYKKMPRQWKENGKFSLSIVLFSKCMASVRIEAPSQVFSNYSVHPKLCVCVCVFKSQQIEFQPCQRDTRSKNREHKVWHWRQSYPMTRDCWPGIRVDGVSKWGRIL